MNNAKKYKFICFLGAFLLCTVMVLNLLGCVLLRYNNHTSETKLYCDDFYFDDYFMGEGTQVKSSYDISYDRKEESLVKHLSAPSYGNGDPEIKNACAPLAAMNIVAYYDRWYNNLVPNYDVGVLYSNGKYFYYPDMHKQATCNVISSLYSLMKTGESGGTTAANFKNGLNEYVNKAGYNLTTTSFYKNEKTVNINALDEALTKNKIGLIMCTTYNFVTSIISDSNTNTDHIVKSNSDAGHMMMVYGYRTIEYYKNNINFQTDTFLLVSSSYSSGETGYIRMNDFVRIDEALIITIS